MSNFIKMKTFFKILCCFFIFTQNNYAQNTTEKTPISPSLGLKISVLGLAEYATCLHISPELRLGKRFAIQPEIGFYTDILRNTNYNAEKSAMSGIRFGGEIRYYLKDWDNEKINWYLGLCYLNNISKVAKMQDALVLRNGVAEVTQTPIRFNHERMFVDAVFGLQKTIKKRIIIEAFGGIGLTNRRISNLEKNEKDITFADCNPQVELLFPSSNLWSGPKVTDTRGFLDIAAGLKIGYRLF
jgi:hypothetical protein